VLGVGLQSDTHFHVDQVAANSPAALAGLHSGDKVVAVNGDALSDWNVITQRIRASHGQPLTLTVQRGGSTFDTTVQPVMTDIDGSQAFRVGLTAKADLVKGNIGDALAGYGRQFKDNVTGLVRLFSPSGISRYASTVTGNDHSSAPSSSATATSGSASAPAQEDRPSSVIGIVDIGSQLFGDGWLGVLSFFVAVNIAIGLINLFPMLPFDGGHIVVALYEGIRSRKGKRYFVDVNKLMPATYAVVMVMGTLALSAMYLDITKGIP
jgi:membrane-associated protease RseP (regulator of RpoE activity)